MTTKEGWHGRYFEDFEAGDVYQHPLCRPAATIRMERSSSRSSAPSWSTSAGRHLRSHAFGQEPRRERNQEQNNEGDGEQQEGHRDLAPPAHEQDANAGLTR